MPNQIRTRPPAAQAQMRPTAINSRPITGQPIAAARGVPMPGVARPPGVAAMPDPGARPAAYQPGPRQMPGQPGRPMPQVIEPRVLASLGKQCSFTVVTDNNLAGKLFSGILTQVK